MAATAQRKYGDNFAARANGETFTELYKVFDATTRAEAKTAIIAAATSYPGYTITDVNADESEQGGVVWDGSVTYTASEYTPSDRKKTNETAFRFETSGGQLHMSHALEHISSTACPGETAPDYAGAINVNGEGEIMGVDVDAPQFNFNVTLYPESITTTYIANLYKLTDTTNDAAISMLVDGVQIDFAEGELRFLGAVGSRRGGGDFEIDLHFSASPNVADVCADWPVSVKPAAAVPKKGWEYAWVRYKDTVDATAKMLVKKPVAVYIERVYRAGDFTLLNIPTPPGP